MCWRLSPIHGTEASLEPTYTPPPKKDSALQAHIYIHTYGNNKQRKGGYQLEEHRRARGKVARKGQREGKCDKILFQVKTYLKNKRNKIFFKMSVGVELSLALK